MEREEVHVLTASASCSHGKFVEHKFRNSEFGRNFRSRIDPQLHLNGFPGKDKIIAIVQHVDVSLHLFI